MRKGGNDTGIIANVFGAFKAKYRPLLLSRGEYVPTGTLRDNDIVGAIADAIAKNVGKLQPQVVRKDEKGMTIKNDYLARILTLRPCPEMSTYDFLYRIAADLVYTSNSFSVIFYNEDFTRVQSIQPITTKSFRIFEDDKHHILFRFRWDYDGETYTVPYQNVIHIKARYNKKRFLGTSPDIELKRSLDLVETSGEIVKNIVNRSNSLAGYLKYNNLADNEELKQIAIGGNMFDRGAMTINEYRALMYYGPVDDGDVRMVSLNYVKAGDQSLYQVGQGGGSSDPPPDPGTQQDKQRRAMEAAARAYFETMKGG